jgi:putrescine transport system ATP-binding protein
MGATPMIRLERLEKRFPGVRAVDGIDLEIAAGEFFSLLGASGCGKTTLLRLIAGLERADAGRILIDGVEMTAAPAWERPVNTVFQSYALFPHMTVAGNVAFGLRQEATPKAEIAARVDETLALVGMREFARRKPDELSGGQRQRVALARALIKRPKILLLDEPMAALDRRLREQTRFELINLQRRLGITFVMVTHDQEEAMGLSSRIAVMDAGRIVQIGAPREIYDRPANRFVAGFVGDANFLAGHAAGFDGGVLQMRRDGTPQTMAGACARDPGEGAPVSLMIRPERARLHRAPPDGNALDGRIEGIAFLGAASVLRIRLADGTPFEVRSADGVARSAIDIGDRVWVSWAPADAVVLEG